MRTLNKAGVVHKTVKVIEKNVPNVLQVQCEKEAELKQPYEWNYGTSTTVTPQPDLSNHLNRHYAAPVYEPMDATQVLAGASLPYQQFVPHDTSTQGYANAEQAYRQHTKAARAYVMNFGTRESQPSRYNTTNDQGQPYLASSLADHWYTASPNPGAYYRKKKIRYMEDSLSIIQLKKGKVRSVADYDKPSTNELVEVSGDDFEGDKVYAKVARLRLNFTVRPPVALDMSDVSVEKQQAGVDPKAQVASSNTTGMGDPSDPPASNVIKAEQWDSGNVVGYVNRAEAQLQQLRNAWIAAGAKIKVRYMRVLQLEHADERHDPDVGHDLFRDWDGQTTFGLLGDDNSPSYHRYMEAQVNKKYYKIIKHKFFTMQAPRSMVQMMVPTYFPLLHSWNTLNTTQTASVTGGTAVPGAVLAAPGDVATNSQSVAGTTTPLTNFQHLASEATNIHYWYPSGSQGSLAATFQVGQNNQPDGTGYTIKQGFTPQRITFGKGSGETSLNMRFNYNKAITMHRSGYLKDNELHTSIDQAAVDGLLDAENPSLLWEPYTKKTRNHKMICIFEPQGVDPALFSRAHWFMPSVSLNIEGHFVYSSQ
jgi:hypothetical protein